MQPPVRFDPTIETTRQDEAKTVDGLIDAFDTILARTSSDYGFAVRSVHAKGHAVLKATFIVDDHLPAELAQGLFAQAGRYDACMRLSTNAGDILPDDISLPRGLAIKVIGVQGERLPGADGATQDFLMVNGPVFQTRTADQFLGNLKLLAKTTDRFERTKEVASSVLRGVRAALGAVGIESTTVNSLGGAPNVDPLGETYFSTTPFRYGDYVAKFSVAPVSTDLLDRTGKVIDASDRPNAIRETLREEMPKLQGAWEFRVQLCRDLKKQPVEDPTVVWDEKETPFQRVATIVAVPQDSWDEAAVRTIDEQLHFSVWTGLTAHQPLGNVNRARKATYRHSAEFRARFNGCPFHEPSIADANAPGKQ